MNKITNEEILYFDYIIEHKRNLLLAYNILADKEYIANSCEGVSIVELNNSEVKTLKDRVINHDISKFSDIEFDTYRKTFYPRNSEEKLPVDFEAAWRSHYVNNMHHPEYHNLFGKKMNKIDTIEMILDWCAMSIKFKDSPLEYFLNKKTKLIEEFGDIINYDYIEKILKAIDDNIMKIK